MQAHHQAVQAVGDAQRDAVFEAFDAGAKGLVEGGLLQWVLAMSPNLMPLD